MVKKIKTNSKDLEKKLDILLSSVDRVYPRTRTLLVRSFLAGLFTAIGTTVGLSIVIALATFTLRQLKVIPPLQMIIQETQIEKFVPQD